MTKDNLMRQAPETIKLYHGEMLEMVENAHPYLSFAAKAEVVAKLVECCVKDFDTAVKSADQQELTETLSRISDALHTLLYNPPQVIRYPGGEIK